MVYFYGDQCVGCIGISKWLPRLPKECRKGLEIYKTTGVKKLCANVIPRLSLFQDGEEVSLHVGSMEKQELMELIRGWAEGRFQQPDGPDDHDRDECGDPRHEVREAFPEGRQSVIDMLPGAPEEAVCDHIRALLEHGYAYRGREGLLLRVHDGRGSHTERELNYCPICGAVVGEVLGLKAS